jgi:hypothetical protein
LAMGTWIIFRSLVIEKVKLDFGNLQHTVLNMMVSSNSDGMVHSRAFIWPWQVIVEAVSEAMKRPDIQFHVAVSLGGYLFVALLLALTWRSLRPSYRIYSLVIVIFALLDFSINICPAPINSLFRHAYYAFPIFIGVPGLFKSKRTRILFSVVCFLLFILLIYGYPLERWIV